MKVPIVLSVVGLGAVVAFAIPVVDCFDIVSGSTFYPTVPHQPCYNCDAVVWALRPGKQCSRAVSLVPGYTYKCFSGIPRYLPGMTVPYACDPDFTNPNPVDAGTTSTIICEKACPEWA